MNLLLHINADARRRLAVLGRHSAVTDAARILADPNTPLVVVCDEDGIAIGVISRMDIVRLFGRATDADRGTVEGIMTRSFLSFLGEQTLQFAWNSISSRGLRCAPLLDDSGRPRGVVHARDLVRALLDEVNSEELLLRNYVLGVGYR